MVRNMLEMINRPLLWMYSSLEAVVQFGTMQNTKVCGNRSSQQCCAFQGPDAVN